MGRVRRRGGGGRWQVPVGQRVRSCLMLECGEWFPVVDASARWRGTCPATPAVAVGPDGSPWRAGWTNRRRAVGPVQSCFGVCYVLFLFAAPGDWSYGGDAPLRICVPSLSFFFFWFFLCFADPAGCTATGLHPLTQCDSLNAGVRRVSSRGAVLLRERDGGSRRRLLSAPSLSPLRSCVRRRCQTYSKWMRCPPSRLIPPVLLPSFCALALACGTVSRRRSRPLSMGATRSSTFRRLSVGLLEHPRYGGVEHVSSVCLLSRIFRHLQHRPTRTVDSGTLACTPVGYSMQCGRERKVPGLGNHRWTCAVDNGHETSTRTRAGNVRLFACAQGA